MREILFRAKRIDSGEWVEGFYFIDERDIEDGYMCRDIPQIQQRYGDHYNYFDIIPETVSQYADIADKNGTKVFEGDYISDGKTIWEVRYHQTMSGFSAYAVSGYISTTGNVFSLYHLCNRHNEGREVEAIGNIHDKEGTCEK